MASKTAPGELDLVREFVNTVELDEDADAIDTPEALGAWLAEHDLLPPTTTVTPSDVRRAAELREALRRLLIHNNGGPRDPEAVAVVNDAAARARLGVRFSADEARLEAETAGVDGALGRILARVAAAMGEGTWWRLKACAEETCEWAFYDATKNRSGRWCSMAVCGNRNKARSYRQRQG